MKYSANQPRYNKFWSQYTPEQKYFGYPTHSKQKIQELDPVLTYVDLLEKYVLGLGNNRKTRK